MITFTRDEAQKLLDTLVEAIDAQQWEIDNHIKTYGEWFRPKRVEYMKDALANTLRTVELLSHKVSEPPKNQVRPHEFLKAVEGKENFAGIPILWAEWPTPEPTIDGWPLWSGLPQPEPEPVAWGVDEGEGRCISLHDLYFVKKDADHMAELKGTHAKVVALYTTPPKKEWVGLTDEEARELCVANVPYVIDMVRALEAKLKEKNT